MLPTQQQLCTLTLARKRGELLRSLSPTKSAFEHFFSTVAPIPLFGDRLTFFPIIRQILGTVETVTIGLNFKKDSSTHLSLLKPDGKGRFSKKQRQSARNATIGDWCKQQGLADFPNTDLSYLCYSTRMPKSGLKVYHIPPFNWPAADPDSPPTAMPGMMFKQDGGKHFDKQNKFANVMPAALHTMGIELPAMPIMLDSQSPVWAWLGSKLTTAQIFLTDVPGVKSIEGMCLWNEQGLRLVSGKLGYVFEIGGTLVSIITNAKMMIQNTVTSISDVLESNIPIGSTTLGEMVEEYLLAPDNFGIVKQHKINKDNQKPMACIAATAYAITQNILNPYLARLEIAPIQFRSIASHLILGRPRLAHEISVEASILSHAQEIETDQQQNDHTAADLHIPTMQENMFCPIALRSRRGHCEAGARPPAWLLCYLLLTRSRFS
jgi:hypothetical protein